MRRAGFGIVAGLLGVWLGLGATPAAQAITLPACDNFTCAFDGDFAVMSLPIAGVNVPSTPGQIKDFVVVYTGASGAEVNTNFSGMDNAYPAVSGKGKATFSTTTTLDPGGVDFTGDDPSTWDSTLAAFLGFLGTGNPIFFFNHNQSNTGATPPNPCGMQTAQDLCAYGMLTLVDLGNPANNVVLELQSPTTLFTDGPQPTNDSTALPGDYVLAPGQVCLDGSGNQVPCSDPSKVIGPINHNLGANNAAYAIFSPELNEKLALCREHGPNSDQCPWDVLRIRIDLAGLTNGYEQLFIVSEAQDIPPVPQPGALLLLGGGPGRRRLGSVEARALGRSLDATA